MQVLNQYLASIEPELRELIRALDALIRKAAPELAASLKWGNLTYHHARNVCCLAAHKRHVNLQVWGGATLADPSSLLTGTGKSMRHIKLTPGQAFDRDAMATIVRAAAQASRT